MKNNTTFFFLSWVQGRLISRCASGASAEPMGLDEGTSCRSAVFFIVFFLLLKLQQLTAFLPALPQKAVNSDPCVTPAEAEQQQRISSAAELPMF